MRVVALRERNMSAEVKEGEEQGGGAAAEGRGQEAKTLTSHLRVALVGRCRLTLSNTL